MMLRKRKEAEIISLKLKLEALMQTNKKLEDDNNNLLSKVPHAFPSNENIQTEVFSSTKSIPRSTSLSSQTSNFFLASDLHASKSVQQKPFQVFSGGTSKHGKPFPPFQEQEQSTDSDIKNPFPFPPAAHPLTTKLLPHLSAGNQDHGKLFPPSSKNKNMNLTGYNEED